MCDPPLPPSPPPPPQFLGYPNRHRRRGTPWYLFLLLFRLERNKAVNHDNEILTVKNLNMYCPLALAGGPLKLLDNISFVVNRNDILGLVGETGGGKSILIDAIGGNPKPPLWVEANELLIRCDHRRENLLQRDEEELRKLWGKEIAFIPPNARDKLNPILRVGKQVANVIEANLQLSRKEAYQKTIELFRMVQMPDPERNFNNYPHELSGGMAQRVVISIALSMSPKLLLADEPTMGLDVTIQTQVLDLMVKFLKKLQSSVVLATRDLGIVANYCNKVAVLCDGQMVEFADVRDFFKNAIHPYSHYLLAAAFSSHGKAVDLESMVTKGEVAEVRSQAGCRFASRCLLAKEVCWSVNPPEQFITPNHYVRCHRWEDK